MHEYIEQNPHQWGARRRRGLHVDSDALDVVPDSLEEGFDSIVELADTFSRL